jgi:hypothetical protein
MQLSGLDQTRGCRVVRESFLVSVLSRHPTKGLPKVNDCGLAEIRNSIDTSQFRQVLWSVCCVVLD